MNDSNRFMGHVNPNNFNQRFYSPKGQLIGGHPIGILAIDIHYPILPGNVTNAYTFDFPVRYATVEGADGDKVHGNDPSIVECLINAVQSLEKEGVRAIVGACGYLGHYQKVLRESINIPLFTSSLQQGPLIESSLKENEKIGIICADPNVALSYRLFEPCGISNRARYVVKSCGDCEEFSGIAFSKGHMNHEKVMKEIVDVATSLVSENKDIGAILLECSDLPPYSYAIQSALSLPVYDYVTLINFVHNSVTHKPYSGFL